MKQVNKRTSLWMISRCHVFETKGMDLQYDLSCGPQTSILSHLVKVVNKNKVNCSQKSNFDFEICQNIDVQSM